MKKKIAFLVLALTTTLGALLTAPTQAASGCYQVCVPEPPGPPCCNTCCHTATGVGCTDRSCP